MRGHAFLMNANFLSQAPLTAAVGALMVAQSAQAFLPTPLNLVSEGELAPTVMVTSTQSITKTDEHQNNHLEPLAENKAVKNQTPTRTQTPSQISSSSLLAQWQAKADSKNLAQHTTWRRLLYFVDDKKSLLGKTKTSNQSLVDNSKFFLSPKGRNDSEAELQAMLGALANEIVNPAAKNNSVICRFPARANWLAGELGFDLNSINADCPELDDWMAMLAPHQLSVMFAQEYLDNPLSAFAHTLLRIDSKASANDFAKINHAYALNDTVNGDDSDNFVIYALKSVSGRYNNIIEIDPYPSRLAKYLQEDERDTWSYRLKLTPSEVKQIMAHVWETKDLGLPYYFTTDNCASEILRLIDVVRPEQHLLSQLSFAVIPSDVIQLLNKENLIEKGRFTPSDSSLRQAQLNKAQALNLPKSKLDAIKSHKDNPVSSISPDGQTLLPTTITAANNNPIDRHYLQSMQLGVGQRGSNTYADIGIQAGYHDMLDNPAGFPQFFNLTGLAATLRVNDTDDNKLSPNRVTLQNFTLIKGRSFNPVNAAKKGTTWGAAIEATRVNDGSQNDALQNSDKDHLVASTSFEYGWSWAFGAPKLGTGQMPPQLCFAMANGTAQAGRGISKGYRVGAGLDTGCYYQINERLRAAAGLQLPYWYHGDSSDESIKSRYWQPISSLGLQYDIDKNQALRLEASYEWLDRIESQEDIKLSYKRYF